MICLKNFKEKEEFHLKVIMATNSKWSVTGSCVARPEGDLRGGKTDIPEEPLMPEGRALWRLGKC